jgi:site-specific recombinase XerD
LDKGVDIHVIQDLLGHRNIAYPRLQIITVEKLLMGNTSQLAARD